jgi:hypothetical protein
MNKRKSKRNMQSAMPHLDQQSPQPFDRATGNFGFLSGRV